MDKSKISVLVPGKKFHQALESTCNDFSQRFDTFTITDEAPSHYEACHPVQEARYPVILLWPSGRDVRVWASEGRKVAFPEDAETMFYDCYSLKKVDLSKSDMSRIKKTDNMFHHCLNLTQFCIPAEDDTKPDAEIKEKIFSEICR